MESLRLIQNQPISLYKRNPTTLEIEEGFTSWETTAYHKRLSEGCYFLGPDYCHPVKVNEDNMTFQFKAATIDPELLGPAFYVVSSSVGNTSISTGRLIDSAANFVADGVGLNMLVVNLITLESAYVDDVTSGTNLLLSEDIFPAFPVPYAVYSVQISGNWHFNGTDYIVETPASGAVEFPGILTLDKYYKITILITDYTTGSLEVKLGNNTIANLSSQGAHVLYGQCQTVTDLQFIASSTFVGSFSRTQTNLYEIEQYYTVALFDLDNTFYSAVLINGDDTSALIIGNILVDISYANFALQGESYPACGKYVIGLFKGDVAPCGGQMITNGNFSSATGWSISGLGIVISGGKCNWTSVDDGTQLINTLNCNIFEDHNYTLSWDVTSLLGTKTGNYRIIAGGVSGPSRDVSLETGIQTYSFTALADGSTVIFEGDHGGTTFQLDNVTLICNDPVLYIADADSLSECYCICDSVPCTIKIEYSSQIPTFGNYYDSGYPKMAIRINGRLRNSNNNDLELNVFKATTDNQIQPYNNLTKIEETSTEPLPEWVHGVLSVGLSHSLVWIGGVAYRRTGAYAPDFGDSELSSVIVNVARKNQENLRNNY